METFDDDFIGEVIGYALSIAQQQRGENFLQDTETLSNKFDREMIELAEATNKWDEIPDIVYYATCLEAQGDDRLLEYVRDIVLPMYHIPVRDAKLACLTKYARRSAGYIKNVAQERRDILQAIGTGKVPVYMPYVPQVVMCQSCGNPYDLNQSEQCLNCFG